MAEEIQYEQFEDADPAAATTGAVDLSRISDIPMELSVEIGRTEMTVGETLALGVGMVVALDRHAGEPVDLLANGTPIARGEVIVVDDRLGLRLNEIIEAPAEADSGHAGFAEPLAHEAVPSEYAAPSEEEPIVADAETIDDPGGEKIAA